MGFSSKAFYTGDGSQNQYQVKFGYIKAEHVFVSVDAVGVSFSWLDSGTVVLDETPVSGTAIEVYRVTPKERMVDFTDGSFTVEADLDLDGTQSLYVSEEAYDLATIARSTANSSITNSAAAVATADEAIGIAQGADTTARLASGNASIAVGTASDADAKADQAIAVANQAQEDADYAVDKVAEKLDVDGNNVDRLSFLTNMGISPEGDIDFSDFALTSGGNIDVASYRFGLGIDELDNKVGVLESSAANTNGSNIDTAAYSEKLGLGDLANTAGTNLDVVSYKAVLAPRTVTTLAGITGNYVGEQVLRISGVADDPDDDIYFWDGTNWCKEGI